jgi:hypothetical protein
MRAVLLLLVLSAVDVGAASLSDQYEKSDNTLEQTRKWYEELEKKSSRSKKMASEAYAI